MFHLISTLSQYGKVGLVCIGATRGRADFFYSKTKAVLDMETKWAVEWISIAGHLALFINSNFHFSICFYDAPLALKGMVWLPFIKGYQSAVITLLCYLTASVTASSAVPLFFKTVYPACNAAVSPFLWAVSCSGVMEFCKNGAALPCITSINRSSFCAWMFCIVSSKRNTQ